MGQNDSITDFAKTLAQVRRANTPSLNDDGTRRVRCVECGKKFTRGANQRHTRCPTCSRVRQIESGRQLANKSGPYYQRMLIGKLKATVAELERLGIDWRKVVAPSETE